MLRIAELYRTEYKRSKHLSHNPYYKLGMKRPEQSTVSSFINQLFDNHISVWEVPTPPVSPPLVVVDISDADPTEGDTSSNNKKSGEKDDSDIDSDGDDDKDDDNPGTTANTNLLCGESKTALYDHLLANLLPNSQNDSGHDKAYEDSSPKRQRIIVETRN
jgi:hypothetical protein